MGFNYSNISWFNYRPQTKFVKVMFLQVSVCRGEGGCGRGSAWQRRGMGGMHGRGGACVAGGLHGRWACMVGGMHGRGNMHDRGNMQDKGGICGRGGMHGREMCMVGGTPPPDTTRYGH